MIAAISTRIKVESAPRQHGERRFESCIEA